MSATSCAAQSDLITPEVHFNKVYYSKSTYADAPVSIAIDVQYWAVFSNDSIRNLIHDPINKVYEEFTRTQIGSYEQITVLLDDKDYYAMYDVCKQIDPLPILASGFEMLEGGDKEVITFFVDDDILSIAPQCAEHSSDPEQYMANYNALRDEIIEIVVEK